MSVFEVYNDAGQLQVTSNQASNVVLADTWTLPKQSTAISQTEVDLLQLYAFTPVAKSKQGVWCYSNGHTVEIYGDPGTQIHYFTDSRDLSSSGDYGLEVYDENGLLTFTSQYPSLNIIDHVKHTASWGVINKKYYGSTNIAIIPNKIPYALTGWMIATFKWWFENDSLCYGIKHLSSMPTPPGFDPTFNYTELDFLVIDTSYF